MTSPRIIQHRSHQSLGSRKVFAYYDSKHDEIHILDRDALYQAILKHELGHRRQRKWLLFFDNTTIFPAFISIALSLVTIGALVTTTLVTRPWSLSFGLGFLLAMLLFSIVGMISDGIAEIKADRDAWEVPLTKIFD